MPTTQDIESAIAELRAAETPNISEIARKYKIERTKLQRLFRGTIGTRAQFIESKQLLSPQQDLQLVKLLDRLTRDGIPPTPKIVRQLAQGLCGKLPSKNWPSTWLKRHQKHFSAGYLIGFDLNRKKADSLWQYTAYFALVGGPVAVVLKLTFKAEREA
jgi:hypothetical protein